jgi:Flp pilus assembly protein TadD
MSSKPNTVVMNTTNDSEASHLRGVVALESGTLQGAVQSFLRAVELAPESAQRALLVSRQLAGAGARIEAEVVLRRALGRSPDRLDLREALVRLLMADGRQGQALDELAATVRDLPEDLGLRHMAAAIDERTRRR